MIQPALGPPKLQAIFATALPARQVLVHGLVLMARIGVFDHEKLSSQQARINPDLAVQESPSRATTQSPDPSQPRTRVFSGS